MKNHCNETHRFTNLHDRPNIEGIRYVDLDATQLKEYMRQKREDYRAKKAAGIPTGRKIIIDGVEVKYADMTLEQRRKYVSAKVSGYRAAARTERLAAASDINSVPVGDKGLRRAQTNAWLKKKLETMTPEQQEAFLKQMRSDPTGIKKARWAEDSDYRRQERIYTLSRRYDLALEKIEELNKITHCPLCEGKFTATILEDKKRTGCYPCVDHRHGTTPVQVRGVLCNECNKHVVEPVEKFIATGNLEKALTWINRPAINSSAGLALNSDPA